MGYQESYIKTYEPRNFDKLVKIIQSNGREAFDMHRPVEIITLLKPIETEFGEFDKGEQFIYVVGERYGQRNPLNFFEYCENVDKDVMDDMDIYFTEYFPSNDIFENNEVTKIALHEEFVWE